MLGDEIIENFKRRIKKDFYVEYLNEPYLILEEKKEIDCTFKLILDNDSDNHFLIIKDLEQLKVSSALYIHKDPPEDCDYVIIDLKENKIYLIELKKKKPGNLEGPSDLQRQLKSGEKWVEHLFFCANVQNLLDSSSWKVYWATFNHRPGRIKKDFEPKVVHRSVGIERPLPIFEGNTFLLRKISQYR